MCWTHDESEFAMIKMMYYSFGSFPYGESSIIFPKFYSVWFPSLLILCHAKLVFELRIELRNWTICDL